MSQPDNSDPVLPYGMHVENPYATPQWRSRLSIGKGARARRRSEREKDSCTLDELNAILWPSGKRMPGGGG